MCLLIAKQAGQEPDWEAYRAGFQYNDDGAGFAVPFGGRVVISKAHWTFDRFKENLEEFSTLPALIHFRIKTHGAVGSDNCHPFDIGHEAPWSGSSEELALGHNGILNAFYDPAKPELSDTRQFIRKVIAPYRMYDPDFLQSTEIVGAIERLCSGSKIALMNHEGDFTILNESLGEHKGGHWYSNSSYNYARATVRRHGYREYNGHYVGSNWPSRGVINLSQQEMSEIMKSPDYLYAAHQLRKYGYTDRTMTGIYYQHGANALVDMVELCELEGVCL